MCPWAKRQIHQLLLFYSWPWPLTSQGRGPGSHTRAHMIQRLWVKRLGKWWKGKRGAEGNRMEEDTDVHRKLCVQMCPEITDIYRARQNNGNIRWKVILKGTSTRFSINIFPSMPTENYRDDQQQVWLRPQDAHSGGSVLVFFSKVKWEWKLRPTVFHINSFFGWTIKVLPKDIWWTILTFRIIIYLSLWENENICDSLSYPSCTCSFYYCGKGLLTVAHAL